MAPKKSPRPNSFVLFAQELMRKDGGKIKSLKEAIAVAGPKWQQMSKQEKKPYDDMANSCIGSKKYAADGVDLEIIRRVKQEEDHSEENARSEIKNIISVASRRGVLDEQMFFLIHINIFCYYPKEDRYWPAEIGVIGFNLREGYRPENVFHEMIIPGPLPLGYSFEAKQHSDETHEIPVSYSGQSNQQEIYNSLKRFLMEKKPMDVQRMPILFTLEKQRKMIKNVLNMWNDAYDHQRDLFRVYNLVEMFLVLRNAVAGNEVWPSHSFSDRELEKDVYAFCPDIACEYHRTSSKIHFCSRSVVIRQAFILCDNCCTDMNIDLIEGQHVPLQSAISEKTGASTCASSVISQATSVVSPWEQDDASQCGVSEIDSDIWESESLCSNTSTLLSNYEDGYSNTERRTFTWNKTTEGSDYTPSGSGAASRNLPNAYSKSLSGGSFSAPSMNFPPIGGRGFRKRDENAPGVGGSSGPRYDKRTRFY